MSKREIEDVPTSEEEVAEEEEMDEMIDEDEMSDSDEEPMHEGLRLRNYVPRSRELEQYQTGRVEILPVQREIDKQLDDLAANAEESEVDDVVLVPPKRNWDLKRDVAPKMAVLDAQTNDALLDILRSMQK